MRDAQIHRWRSRLLTDLRYCFQLRCCAACGCAHTRTWVFVDGGLGWEMPRRLRRPPVWSSLRGRERRGRQRAQSAPRARAQGPPGAQRAVRYHSGIWRKQNSRVRHAVYISTYKFLNHTFRVNRGQHGPQLEFEVAVLRAHVGAAPTCAPKTATSNSNRVPMLSAIENLIPKAAYPEKCTLRA